MMTRTAKFMASLAVAALVLTVFSANTLAASKKNVINKPHNVYIGGGDTSFHNTTGRYGTVSSPTRYRGHDRHHGTIVRDYRRTCGNDFRYRPNQNYRRVEVYRPAPVCAPPPPVYVPRPCVYTPPVTYVPTYRQHAQGTTIIFNIRID